MKRETLRGNGLGESKEGLGPGWRRRIAEFGFDVEVDLNVVAAVDTDTCRDGTAIADSGLICFWSVGSS